MRSILLLLTILVAATLRPTPLPACAVMPHRGDRVGVNAEEAVILYDAKAGVEHFIRRANFRTEAKDFGFLVPTPSRPELGEANAIIFDALRAATAPREVFSGNTQRIVRKRFDNVGAAASPAPPKVLEEKTVAGFDAVVLQADDTAGLKKWLEDHQYDARPAAMEWLKWYVENKWIITAFKVSQAPNARNDRWAKSVRMSFATKQPFYPYREPADVRAGTEPRKLHVFFLSDSRYDGTLGANGIWPGEAKWANACPPDTLKTVIGNSSLPESIAAATPYLTEFEDASAPRPGTDEVYFQPAKAQVGLERPVKYFDKYEYFYEDEIGRGYSFTLIFGLAAGALAIIALLGYLLVLKSRSESRGEE